MKLSLRREAFLVLWFGLAALTNVVSSTTCPEDKPFDHGDSCTKVCPTPYIKEKTCVDLCPGGWYLNKSVTTKGKEHCFECPPGQYQDEATASENCKICPEGKYGSDNGTIFCANCNEGYFQDHPESVHCKPCPEGSRSEEAEGSHQCVPCQPGHYQSDTGQGSCLLCPTGQYQDEEGGRACKKCETNMYQDEEGATVCKICPDEKNNDNVPPPCRWKYCPRGYRKTTAEDTTQCVICGEGTYQPDEDGAVCLQCPRGFYSNRRGSVRCKQCPENAWTPKTGMKSFYDCSGPSIQLFQDRDHQERYIVAYGSQGPALLPLDFEMQFKFARILSGKWKIDGVAGDQEEGSIVETDTFFTIPDLTPIINNVLCYFPLDLAKFVGKINKTVTGDYCGPWDDTLEDPSNWCTTEDRVSSYTAPGPEPWCIDKQTRTAVSCGVPTCGWDTICVSSIKGQEYRGPQQTTKRGYNCRNWEADWPHPNPAYENEADYGVGDHNYCRNPDETFPLPFCYTTNWLKRYDECNVPLCTEDHPRYLY